MTLTLIKPATIASTAAKSTTAKTTTVSPTTDKPISSPQALTGDYGISGTQAVDSDILNHVYSASLDSDLWPVALQALCQLLDADIAQMLYIDPNALMFSFSAGYGFDPHQYDIGAAKFRRHLGGDPVANYGISHLNEVFSDARVVPHALKHASAMHQEIRVPARMEHMLTVFLTDGSLDWTGLCFFRRPEKPPFSAQDEQALSRFCEHIRRATFIHKSLASTTYSQRLNELVLDKLGMGVLMMDDNQHIISCNSEAQSIIAATGALQLNDNLLNANNQKDDARLKNVMQLALNNHSEHEQAMVVKITGAHDDVFASITKLQLQPLQEKRQPQNIPTAHYTATIPARANLLVTLHTVSHKHPPVEALKDIFKLTTAEAELALLLADGHPLQKAASQLERSTGTARVQLQSIFRKTNTNRQANLVRLLCALPT